jgi:hypothetical protein
MAIRAECFAHWLDQVILAKEKLLKVSSSLKIVDQLQTYLELGERNQ